MTGSFHGSSRLCSLLDVGRWTSRRPQGHGRTEDTPGMGAVGCQHSSLHFAPEGRHSLQILHSRRVDCPLGVSWPGPSLRITKFPQSQLRRRTRPFITLPCRWKGVVLAEANGKPPRQSIVRGKKAEASLLGSCPVRPRPRPGSVRAAACRGITNHRTGAGRPCDRDGHTDGSEGRRG